MDGDPFVGPFEGGWRLVCPRVGLRGPQLIVTMRLATLLGIILIGTILFWDNSGQAWASILLLIPIFGTIGLFLFLYVSHVTHPARVLELRKDSVLLYEQGKGADPIVDIPYTRDVEVDVYLNKNVRWGDQSMLYGWTFRKGNDRIRLHPDDN